jgi:hypothetical protein
MRDFRAKPRRHSLHSFIRTNRAIVVADATPAGRCEARGGIPHKVVDFRSLWQASAKGPQAIGERPHIPAGAFCSGNLKAQCLREMRQIQLGIDEN